MIVLNEVETLCKSIKSFNYFLVDCVDKAPTLLSPKRLLPLEIDMSLREDLRRALHPIEIKYEEILLDALKKCVAGMGDPK